MSEPIHNAVRPGVRALPPLGRNLVDESLHRLQWNESPEDFPADLKEEVLQRMAALSWSRYPLGGRPWLLIDALAAQMGVAPQQVVVSEGSADLIKAVMAATLRPGDTVVMPAPTFLLYRQNEFCDQDLTGLLDLGNVILLRTFSKFYAMAGVRVGYALASLALAAELQKVVTVFPLSVFSEVAALVALEHRDRFLAMRDRVVAERERIGAALAVLPGVQVIPSGTNFVLVQLDRPKADVLHHLHHRHSLLISDMAAYPELVNCVRISVGTQSQNDLVIQGFREVLG